MYLKIKQKLFFFSLQRFYTILRYTPKQRYILFEIYRLKNRLLNYLNQSEEYKMVLSEGESIIGVAKAAFKKGQPAFRFVGSNGKISGIIENLPDLVSFLPQVHPLILQHHMSKDSVYGIVDNIESLGTVDILGIPTPISDLPMWILYVLGDKELAETLNHLSQEVHDTTDLKIKVIEACRSREQFLLAQVAKTNE